MNRRRELAGLILAGVFVVILVGVGIWIRVARETALRANVGTLRAVVGQYTNDLRRRPHSLNDLVVAGYLKRVPLDPITGRNDTWILECSNDVESPGIVDVRSGHGSEVNNGPAACR